MTCSPDRVLGVTQTHKPPFYALDLREFASRVRTCVDLLDTYAYPLKSNPHQALVRAAVEAGADLDLCSEGDLDIALSLSHGPLRASFTSAVLSSGLAQRLANAGVAVDLDSEDQLDCWSRAGGMSAGVRVCTADANSPYGAKFGVIPAAVPRLVEQMRSRGLEFTGLHIHDAHANKSPREWAASILATLLQVDRAVIESSEYMNIGGGWPMNDGLPVDVESLAPHLATIRSELATAGFYGRLIAEPGEWAVGPAGWLVAHVAAVKPHPVDAARTIVVLDTATPVPCRASVAPFVLVRDGAPVDDQSSVVCDVYGSANTGLDTVGLGVELPRPREGDIVVSAAQGAYALQLTGSFNERPLPGVVVLGD